MYWRLLIAVAVWANCLPLIACPFCTKLRPTLAQQRDAADVALLGELVSADGPRWKVHVHHTLKAARQPAPKGVMEFAPASGGDERLRPGTLLLALGSRRPADKPGEYSWTTLPLNEASYAYVARSPTLKTPVAKRLPYFLGYLEHADPLVADDVYLEFGHAPFDEIAKLADRLPVDRLREWLTDAATPPERKGLYGLLLGLAASAQGRGDLADVFWRSITSPASDFRSGFDGVLGGYLWLGKSDALARLEKRYLDDPQAATGDVRHLMAALRVYHDYGHDIPGDELLRVHRRFLDRPELAAAAVGDLRRWHDWQALDRVASLFGRPGYTEPSIERAVIGYLLACPFPAAERQVARLRKLVPERVAEAERIEAGEAAGK